MFKLYQLTENYQIALDVMLDEESPSKLIIDEIIESFEKKVINCVKYLKNLEAERDAIKKEMDNMALRYKSVGNKVDSLSDYIAMNINDTGLLDPIKCPEFTVKLQNNPPAVEIDNAELIPDAYKVVKQSISFDKNMMKKDITEGFDIEGARLVTRKRLVIK